MGEERGRRASITETFYKERVSSGGRGYNERKGEKTRRKRGKVV